MAGRRLVKSLVEQRRRLCPLSDSWDGNAVELAQATAEPAHKDHLLLPRLQRVFAVQRPLY
jgi:hypothetical protein